MSNLEKKLRKADRLLGIEEQGRYAFKSLNLNTENYQQVIDNAVKGCPYFGESSEAWHLGFNSELYKVIDGLKHLQS